MTENQLKNLGFALDYLESFIQDHENKEEVIQCYDELVTLRVDDFIDWSEAVAAIEYLKAVRDEP